MPGRTRKKKFQESNVITLTQEQANEEWDKCLLELTHLEEEKQKLNRRKKWVKNLSRNQKDLEQISNLEEAVHKRMDVIRKHVSENRKNVVLGRMCTRCMKPIA
jgi:predicted Holliday junction resolvase-like endonuclease